MGKNAAKPRREVGIKRGVLAKKPLHMTKDEKRLAREMAFERKMGRADVAKALGRDLSAICRLTDQSKVPKERGRGAEGAGERAGEGGGRQPRDTRPALEAN